MFTLAFCSCFRVASPSRSRSLALSGTKKRKTVARSLASPWALSLPCFFAEAMVEMKDHAPWKPSIATNHHLQGLVSSGLLLANTDPKRPVRILPGSDVEPNLLSGYVVSLARLHERGLGVPTGRFIWAL